MTCSFVDAREELGTIILLSEYINRFACSCYFYAHRITNL